ncbi:hypothetical protein, partial [Limnohabitans sp.]|uniref:hypothetical protein n=1 Tax=Limnohabitans sp. TaxID=1907725 RepID=UPI00391D44EE
MDEGTRAVGGGAVDGHITGAGIQGLAVDVNTRTCTIGQTALVVARQGDVAVGGDAGVDGNATAGGVGCGVTLKVSVGPHADVDQLGTRACDGRVLDDAVVGDQAEGGSLCARVVEAQRIGNGDVARAAARGACVGGGD